MQKRVDEMEKVGLKIDTAKQLALLLEDHFYNYFNDDDFVKNQTLSTVVVEKIKEANKALNDVIQREMEGKYEGH